MFVILGATGHTGSVVADTLLARKQPVRVVVRSADKGVAWKAKGAEVAVASLDDVSAMTKALQGAQGVYLLVPPNYGATAWLAKQRQRMDQAVEAVKASGVSHVVFLSSVGGQIAEGTGPIRAARYGEQQLGAVEKNLTILRPSYFMENWASGIGMAKGQGLLPTFIAPTAKVPMISTRDIGRVGAECLIAGGQGKQVVELAGPREYSPEEAAAALGQILGRSVSAQFAPLSAVVPTFTSFGFSLEAATLFEEMYAAFAKGMIGYEHPEQLVRGTVTLAEALRGMVQEREANMTQPTTIATTVTKELVGVYPPGSQHMVGDGFPVRNMIPGRGRDEQFSPFLLLDYMGPEHFPPTNRQLGVGEHPHRGFETVTILYHGKVAHRDSTGSGGVIGPGDVQWMTAASGIVHEELHEKEFAKQGGLVEGIQLWVNLPKAFKMSKPGYQTLVQSEIPTVELEGGAGRLRVIAGAFRDIKGPAKTFSPVHLYDLQLKAGHQMELLLPEGFNSSLFVLHGQVVVNGSQAVREVEIALFGSKGERVLLEAKQDATLLILSGEPIAEPIARYGPFVMNTRDEINQAVQDYQAGKMGHLS